MSVTLDGGHFCRGVQGQVDAKERSIASVQGHSDLGFAAALDSLWAAHGLGASCSALLGTCLGLLYWHDKWSKTGHDYKDKSRKSTPSIFFEIHSS